MPGKGYTKALRPEKLDAFLTGWPNSGRDPSRYLPNLTEPGTPMLKRLHRLAMAIVSIVLAAIVLEASANMRRKGGNR